MQYPGAEKQFPRCAWCTEVARLGLVARSGGKTFDRGSSVVKHGKCDGIEDEAGKQRNAAADTWSNVEAVFDCRSSLYLSERL